MMRPPGGNTKIIFYNLIPLTTDDSVSQEYFLRSLVENGVSSEYDGPHFTGRTKIAVVMVDTVRAIQTANDNFEIRNL